MKSEGGDRRCAMEAAIKLLEIERCYEMARPYRSRVLLPDRDDFVQDAVLEMWKVAQRRGEQGMPDAYLRGIARMMVRRYWARRNGHHHRLVSLNQPIRGTEAPIELWETLPDKDIDLAAQLDAKRSLEALPPGIKKIARKLEKGDPLTPGEEARLLRFRQDGKKPRPWQARWERERYWKRRASGLCVVCGEEANGFARCPGCREVLRQYQALYKRRKGKKWYTKLREHWRKQGRCPRCGRPPQPGRKKCPQCLAKDREYLRRWRQDHSANTKAGENGANRMRQASLLPGGKEQEADSEMITP
jgi:hypothetical protein